MVKAETADHDTGLTGSEDEPQAKGQSLRPRFIPFNLRHVNELANVGSWAPSLDNAEKKASSKRVEAQPELTFLFTTCKRSLNPKIQ